ncbi:chloride channel protein [Fibrobacterota bacterium]
MTWILKHTILRWVFLNYIRLLNRAKMTEYGFMVIMAAFIGVMGGLGAIGFRYLIGSIQNISWGTTEYSLEAVRALPWYWIIPVPAAGGLLVGLLVYFFAREAKGHGVPEVMEAVALRHGVIRPRVVLAKMFASAICIATGGSVGREGPIVQIGSAFGSTLGQLLRVSKKRLRTFVGCGAAAGISATFNAPIAGAIFSLEIILSDFGVPQFSPIVISSVLAAVVSRHYLGNFPAFSVSEYQLISPWELITYTMLGLACGFVAVTYIRSVYFLEDNFDKLKVPGYAKAALGGFIIGCIGVFFPEIFGVGYETISSALEGGLAWKLLLVLLIIKLLATSITLGSGGSGGIFAPSLFLGAMTGGLLGTVFHTLFPGITAESGAYAIVGMGAVVAAATHAPITAILIIFELTSDYKIVLPLMLACIISTIFALRMKRESIYTLKLIRRGVNIFKGQEKNILKSILVKSIMNNNVTLVSEDTPISRLVELAGNSSRSSFYVEDESHAIVGVIDDISLRQALASSHHLKNIIIAEDITNTRINTVQMNDSLDNVMRLFASEHVDELPVISSEHDKKVIGIININDALAAYNNALLKREHEEASTA